MNKRILAALCILAAVSGCVDANTTPAGDANPPTEAGTTVPGSGNGPAMGEAERAQCLAAGGTVERRGRLQSELCVTPFADAGKVCTDGSQCGGDCIVEGRATPSSGTVQGICQRDDRLFGCYSRVENGAITTGLCVD